MRLIQAYWMISTSSCRVSHHTHHKTFVWNYVCLWFLESKQPGKVIARMSVKGFSCLCICCNNWIPRRRRMQLWDFVIFFCKSSYCLESSYHHVSLNFTIILVLVFTTPIRNSIRHAIMDLPMTQSITSGELFFFSLKKRRGYLHYVCIWKKCNSHTSKCFLKIFGTNIDNANNEQKKTIDNEKMPIKPKRCG